MARDPDLQDPRTERSKKLVWIIGGLIIAVLVIVALQGLLRGGGEAAGVESAAPGDDNVSPAPDTKSPLD